MCGQLVSYTENTIKLVKLNYQQQYQKHVIIDVLQKLEVKVSACYNLADQIKNCSKQRHSSLKMGPRGKPRRQILLFEPFTADQDTNMTSNFWTVMKTEGPA